MKGSITTPNKEQEILSFDGATSAQNINGTTIQINWTLSELETATAYNIYLVDDDSNLTLLGSVGVTENLYVHSGLNYGNLYRYVVRVAVESGRTDENKNIVSAIAYAGITTATVVDATTVDLTFPSAVDATSIKIYCSTGSSNTMNLMATVSSSLSGYQLTSLPTQVLHTCKVKAVLSDGTEDNNSQTISFTPDVVSSSSPFGFAGITSAVNIDGSSVLVSWNAASPTGGMTISGYRIYQISSGGDLNSYTALNTDTNYTVTGLTIGESYNFYVRAISAADSSTDSNSVMKSVLMYSGITTAAAASATSGTLTFPASPLGSSIHVYCYVSSGSPPSTPSASLANTASSYTINGLTTATQYTCFVKAVGASGEDGNSATATFTTQ